MDTEIATKLADWLRWDKNPTTLGEIKRLAATNDANVLQSRLCGRLSFGTAGLRGVMRAGFASMNDLVIIQTAQGLCHYVRQQFPDAAAQKRGIVIGFDGRHNSRRFARLTAAVFVHAGLPVWLYSETVATPFVPFAIMQLGCLAGVMVTASHNPKEDNGYKVYWSNGAQIIGPHDKGIEQAIRENLEPLPTSWDDSVLAQSPLLLRDPLREQSAAYLKELLARLPTEQLKVNESSDVRFVYTAMHGVGYEYVRQAFEAAHLRPVIAVPEQRDSDPEFPTVRFPNPEEGASSLELSMRLANREGIDVILANDPDADRLACAERNPATGEWHVFSGNELGALLGWWSWQQFRAVHPTLAPADCVMLCSTVSSMILRALAAKEGFSFEDTLTGFKWMGNRAVELAAEGKHVVFAFEEAIGFMVSTAVLDKDGVSAAVHLASLVAWLRAADAKQTLTQKLHELYDEYGFHCTVNSYYICHEADVIERIFERIRRWDGKEGKYPSTLCDGRYTVRAVRDLTTGFDSSQPDGRARLPSSKSSQMITFSFANGVMLTLRTSGTEPKVKYYTEMCATPEQKDWTALRTLLTEQVAAVVEELLQPNVNGLIARSD